MKVGDRVRVNYKEDNLPNINGAEGSIYSVLLGTKDFYIIKLDEPVGVPKVHGYNRIKKGYGICLSIANLERIEDKIEFKIVK